jgi:DNA-binding transcriptional LysR family regulator
MPVKLQQLVYFVRVAEEGQMTRAAKSLHLAQPALSQAIAHLESQLGVELLERHPRGVDLTPAGKAFFAKARVALSAAADAELTAQSLTRAAKSMIELGFLGSPPMLDAPELFAAFAYLHPELEVSFRELPFPCGPTATWLEEVDVALCFAPTADPEVRIQPLRVEPRVVVAAKTHRLARRKQLTVEEVLDETFPGIHPAVDPVWAGFWQLDDHRGAPAPHLTGDRAINPHELAAIIASGRAITATPASNAENIVRALTNVVAIPLRGADPVTLSLVWSKDSPNPLVDAIVVAASNLARTGVPREPPDGA